MTKTTVDCDTCVMRDIACGECVLSVIMGPVPLTFDDDEQAAMRALAASGLVPKLEFGKRLRAV